MRLDEFMVKNVKIHDTCGIQFSHGIPGMLGAVTASVCAGVAVYNFQGNLQLQAAFPTVTSQPGGRNISE